MSSEQKEHFRQRLLQERSELNELILASSSRARDELDQPRDSDVDERSELADDALGLATRLTEQVHEVDDALARIESGDYGLCEECGEPIASERLEAEPAARFCAKHARSRERRSPPKL